MVRLPVLAGKRADGQEGTAMEKDRCDDAISRLIRVQQHKSALNRGALNLSRRSLLHKDTR